MLAQFVNRFTALQWDRPGCLAAVAFSWVSHRVVGVWHTVFAADAPFGLYKTCSHDRSIPKAMTPEVYVWWTPHPVIVIVNSDYKG